MSAGGRRGRWRNVWTIFRREVRDQLRDRRTLFMVFVLPLLLYPILGIGILQLSATLGEKPRTVIVLGAENLPGSPPLLNDARDRFVDHLFPRARDANILHVEVAPPGSKWTKPGVAEQGVRDRLADAVVTIPADVRAQVEAVGTAKFPIFYDSTHEPSQLTSLRVREVLERWADAIVEGRLARDNKPAGYTEPVKVAAQDVAPEGKIGVNIWARIFPFLLVIMALTGAFYPAVDICAGEKERGTMETLLISPATRTEIVLGKFFTVMLASVMTALLNLLSMGVTGIQIAAKLTDAGPRAGSKMASIVAPPQLSSYFWMLLLLIPLAGFFSALCVALAVLARSMKEGQYYMTPLYLVSLPLILVTLMPEISLNLFYALIPITGPSLLLKALILGEYGTARTYFLPVILPTLVYGWISLRWAVDLFRREDVIFRESEVFDLRLWLVHLVRDKEPRPYAGAAIFCFATMLSLAWFSLQAIGTDTSPLVAMVIGHLAFILGPPVALTLLFTSDWTGTLRLRTPRLRDVLLAAGLALTLNPAYRELAQYVERLFPASELVKSQLGELAKEIPNLWMAIGVFALVPAITEEFAFRGFILSGLRRTYDARTSVILSALLFGFLHVLLSLFQQLFGATILGLVLGVIALRTGSIWPGVAFHFVNNALGVLTSEGANHPSLARFSDFVFRDRAEGLYQLGVIIPTTILSVFLLFLLCKGDETRRPMADGFDG